MMLHHKCSDSCHHEVRHVRTCEFIAFVLFFSFPGGAALLNTAAQLISFFFFFNLIVPLKVCVCVVQAAAEDGAGLFLHRIPAEPAADQRHGHTEGQDPLL